MPATVGVGLYRPQPGWVVHCPVTDQESMDVTLSFYQRACVFYLTGLNQLSDQLQFGNHLVQLIVRHKMNNTNILPWFLGMLVDSYRGLSQRISCLFFPVEIFAPGGVFK